MFRKINILIFFIAKLVVIALLVTLQFNTSNNQFAAVLSSWLDSINDGTAAVFAVCLLVIMTYIQYYHFKIYRYREDKR